MQKDEILKRMQEMMEELFDIEKEKVTLDAKLYEDLDLDSIDAIDLVVQIQKETKIKVQPEDFKNVRTVADVVDAVYKLTSNESK
ncbi:Acyl carrier protein [Anaerobiospirillum thomasii]|uniref:Acyl carrier protein n=1 Tax=Anaerobiospirillum thomasii TaxID=179995 RepID=A0A2X0WUL5_9GAMM|nr:acyl carrier protein [Anaerobiospirillum thomasii]SPT69141.1 Acyl carrier protein [Anaerobiospirillum thomasii]SPT72307.1 Acyl carrier protein [Anaerobiospirillum thomasii]